MTPLAPRNSDQWWMPLHLSITHVFGRLFRLNVAELRREWGEASWTAKDLW